ncbi:MULTISPECIES: hypothetical protein [unclassified Agarivorans]|uniref:hypothetical protein n=1 Tax=unclassified Agarivorans TaxID=2636026 RepID=UPI003D7CB90E
MLKTIYFLCFISLASFAKPLRIPDTSAGNIFPAVLAQEIVKRSELYDSVAYPYGAVGDVVITKAVADLNDGGLDLIWTATSAEREQELTAIYFPIFRGIIGMRLGIIKQQNRQRFSQVNSWDEMREYIPCQGKLWADTAILEANGVKVAKSLGYPNIFAMVEAERCDYFPRGIFEPWGELQREAQYNLTVDPYVMLRYKMPLLFFVKKDNQHLAEHLYGILQQMFEDGSYQALFLNHPDVKNALQQGQLAQRRIFDLDNPYLTEKVRAIPQEFWFDPVVGN